jgi:hypothetical protein
MSVKDEPHYSVQADTLAHWIENQTGVWWSAYADPLLASLLDFPCPGDELAPVVRSIGKPLLVRDRSQSADAHGQLIEDVAGLDAECDTNNWRHRRTLLLAWAGSDIDWILSEDEALVDKR